MRLLSSANIGAIKTRNRIIRAAVHERGADDSGRITAVNIAVCEQLARGGAGLIITGFYYVNPLGVSTHNQTGLENDERVFQLQELTSAVHRHGCPIVAQLCHAGRQSNPKLLRASLPVAPSPITDKSTGITPRELSKLEIEDIIEDFYRAAMRAKQAGFDGVELHAAHGYLLSAFLSPCTNQRHDIYGGNLANRARIVQMIIRRIKERYAEELAVLVKVNCADFLPGGNKIAESIEIGRLIAAAGADALEISGGMWESGDKITRRGIKKSKHEAYFKEEARQMKRAVGCPVILVGGLRSLEVMENIISHGYADLVSLARPFIREPDFVAKLKDGKEKCDCISCNGCLSRRAHPTHCIRVGMPNYLVKAIAREKTRQKKRPVRPVMKKRTKSKVSTKKKPRRSKKKPAAPARKAKTSSLKKRLLKIKKRILS